MIVLTRLWNQQQYPKQARINNAIVLRFHKQQINHLQLSIKS